ncbi:AAA family ATPase [Brevibacterium sediminis]|uniref:AAA family ATPase n=1 Tax=Brevibacterium sediminis TaxID=1857024 RepID=UPI0021754081|nr:AAA family ATPase [Brevibacterium sediminis]MCS4594776.1 AAA family ATPase [Brevibacterium sediminis]
MSTPSGIRELFGIDADTPVPRLEGNSDLVPTIDENYRFDPQVTRAILAGFSHGSRVLVQGLHGTGKSTHIEQIAARLNWPLMRVNLDGQISRSDLVGKDQVVIEDGQPRTAFEEGVIPYALTRPMALVFDEYDAGRPEVMFIIQRLLERDGLFTLTEQNRVIRPHPHFRLFATANTVGLGNVNGLYHGVHRLNQAQLDRWNIIASLNYLDPSEERLVVTGQVPEIASAMGEETVAKMIDVAQLTRTGFAAGDVSALMSPRTVISWAQNSVIFGDVELAFKFSFLNRCDVTEHPVVAEYYQRCFGGELSVDDAATAS